MTLGPPVISKASDLQRTHLLYRSFFCRRTELSRWAAQSTVLAPVNALFYGLAHLDADFQRNSTKKMI